MRHPPSGFTLIELLVVISIVVVLAGMLLPAIETVRGSARSAHCQGNLRMFGMANFTYAEDYDGISVPNVQFDAAAVMIPGSGWAMLKAFKDLANDKDNTGDAQTSGWRSGLFCPEVAMKSNIHWCYAMNIAPTPLNWTALPNKKAAWALSVIPRKTELMMFVEGCDGSVFRGNAANYTGAEGYLQGAVAYRHRRVVRGNAVMWDGHVQPVARADLIASDLNWK